MIIQDEEILKRLDTLFPVRARLQLPSSGGKGRFELLDKQGQEIEINGISALRIIAVLRKNNYIETFEEINALDGEIVFGKPALHSAGVTSRLPHPMDSHPYVLNFF